MSIYDKDLFGKSKHETAIARIRAFCEGKRTLVAFSGGKDSQCCYHLCQEAGIEFTAQYSITRFEPPELIQFIRANYPDCVFRRAYKRTLIDDIAEHGLPSRWYRWCCDAKHTKTVGFDITVVGVRAAESPRRAANWRAFGFKQDKTAYVCPIFEWTTEDVWEYLNSRGVPHCCLYDAPWNMRRIGCVCCPLAPRSMRLEAELWPKSAAVLRLGNKRNFEKIAACGGKTKHGVPYKLFGEDADEVFERWLDTGQTLPADTANQDDEPCLFAGTGFSESDGADGAEDGDA